MFRTLMLACLLTFSATSTQPPQADAGQSSGGQSLMAYADVSEAGFSADQLEQARQLADKNRSAAVVALHRGHVVAAWGAIDRPLMAHSVRKSLAGALYGLAIEDGSLSLSSTLAELGIDDVPPLTDLEKTATFGQVIAARSGVYHGAAYAGDQDSQRPARGSHAPGTFWFYNNWDFNVAETIYEQATGSDIYEAFSQRIARPLGMTQFDPAKQVEAREPWQSRFVAHTFRLSTLDLARFGQLYLQNGRWGDQQVVPAQWVRDSLTAHSDIGDGAGYGYLWWIYGAGSLGPNLPVLNTMDVFLARGTGGQGIFLIPQAEMVVVHRGDTDNGRSVSGPAIWQMVERIVAARQGIQTTQPRLGPVVATPLTSSLPPPPAPEIIQLSPAARAQLVGEYVVEPGQVVPAGVVGRVFEEANGLFIFMPGQGGAELSAVTPLSFIVQTEGGLKVEFDRGADGAVTGMTVTVGPQKIRATRK